MNSTLLGSLGRTFNQIIAEIISSAEERTLSPQGLSQNIIDTIIKSVPKEKEIRFH